jgi:hypothetical protein
MTRSIPGKAKRAKARKAKKPRAAPPPRPELNAASRAQLGADDEKRSYRPKAEDASVEDPLRDWPEDE